MRGIVERFGANFAREITLIDLEDLAAFVKEGQHAPFMAPQEVINAAARLAQTIIDSDIVIAFTRYVLLPLFSPYYSCR